MCKCTPEIRTPFCGKGDCVWPHKKKDGHRQSATKEFEKALIEKYRTPMGTDTYVIDKQLIEVANWARTYTLTKDPVVLGLVEALSELQYEVYDYVIDTEFIAIARSYEKAKQALQAYKDEVKE